MCFAWRNSRPLWRYFEASKRSVLLADHKNRLNSHGIAAEICVGSGLNLELCSLQRMKVSATEVSSMYRALPGQIKESLMK